MVTTFALVVTLWINGVDNQYVVDNHLTDMDCLTELSLTQPVEVSNQPGIQVNVAVSCVREH